MESAEQTSFGTLLKTYRKRVRKTQQQLAECLDISREMIIKWEKGDALPKDRARIEEVRRCLQLTDTQRDTLLKAALLVAPQQIWHVPVPRTLFFTGRKDVLEHIRTLLTTQKKAVLTQAITGLGGIGKTQTAREYIYRYQQEYQAVLWVQADSQEQLVNSVILLAQKLNLPEREVKEQEQILEAFEHWLETHSGWLLVLDNVEELSLIQAVLPSRGQGQVLITTRSQAVGTLARPLALHPFSPQIGAILLLRRANLSFSPSNKVEATALSEMLGGLPLALDQAGAFMQETGHGPAEYRILFEQAKGELLRRRGRVATDHLDSVAVTFELAWAKLNQASPAAGELLRLCAFLAPATIPEELFTEVSETLPTALRESLALPLGWPEVLALLRRYSLLEREGETKTLAVHRLVQDVLREELDPDSRRQWAEQVVRLVNAVFPSVEFSTWPRCQRLAAHAQACAEQIAAWGFAFPESARLLNQLGYYLSDRAAYDQALPLLQLALTIREQTLGQEHPEVATSLNNLANLYNSKGDYVQALPLFQRALAIREMVLGPEHLDVAESLNDLANVYYPLGQYAEGIPLLLRALAIREEQLGPNHPFVADSLNNLANLYWGRGQYTETLPLLERALVIREQTYGPDHPEFAISLNNLANIYYTLGQYDAALPLFERALAIAKRACGPDHPRVAIALNNLANTYRNLGRYAEALPLLQHALAIKELTYGPDHSETAYTLNNLAKLYFAQKNYIQALPIYQRALAIREQSLPPNHPDVAFTLTDLARLYYALEDYALARPLFERALAIREQTLGPTHPEVAVSLEYLVALLRDLGEVDQAAEMEARVQAIRAKRG